MAAVPTTASTHLRAAVPTSPSHLTSHLGHPGHSDLPPRGWHQQVPHPTGHRARPVRRSTTGMRRRGPGHCPIPKRRHRPTGQGRCRRDRQVPTGRRARPTTGRRPVSIPTGPRAWPGRATWSAARWWETGRWWASDPSTVGGPLTRVCSVSPVCPGTLTCQETSACPTMLAAPSAWREWPRVGSSVRRQRARRRPRIGVRSGVRAPRDRAWLLLPPPWPGRRRPSSGAQVGRWTALTTSTADQAVEVLGALCGSSVACTVACTSTSRRRASAST